MAKSALNAIVMTATVLFGLGALAKPEQAQTLDQALRESTEQRIAATQKFRQKHTEGSKELDPFTVMPEKEIMAEQKKQVKPKRQPATPEKKAGDDL